MKHPTAFTLATLASAHRSLMQVRDEIQMRACTVRDRDGGLVPVLGATVMAIQDVEKAIRQLEESDA